MNSTRDNSLDSTMTPCAQTVWLSAVLSGSLVASIGAVGALHNDLHSLQLSVVGLSLLALGNFQLRPRGAAIARPMPPGTERRDELDCSADAMRELQWEYLRRRQSLAQRLGSPGSYATQRNTSFVRQNFQNYQNYTVAYAR